MKKKVRKKLDECLKIGDLKQLIDSLPDDTPICRIGHFGELCLFSKHNIDVRTINEAYLDMSRKDYIGTIKVVEIYPPYIGPEPD